MWQAVALICEEAEPSRNNAHRVTGWLNMLHPVVLHYNDLGNLCTVSAQNVLFIRHAAAPSDGLCIYLPVLRLYWPPGAVQVRASKQDHEKPSMQRRKKSESKSWRMKIGAEKVSQKNKCRNSINTVFDYFKIGNVIFDVEKFHRG